MQVTTHCAASPARTTTASDRIERAREDSRELNQIAIALQQWPGTTAYELASYANLSAAIVTRRLPQLARADRIRRSDRLRRCLVSDRNLFAWFPK